MSYDESTKTKALDMYIDFLRAGIREQNILTRIAKEMQISRETLRVWRRDGHWSLKANVEILKSAKLEFMQILRKLPDQLTPDNAAEMGRLVFDAIQSVEAKPNGTESNSQTPEQTGNSGGPPVGQATSQAESLSEDPNKWSKVVPPESDQRD